MNGQRTHMFSFEHPPFCFFELSILPPNLFEWQAGGLCQHRALGKLGYTSMPITLACTPCHSVALPQEAMSCSPMTNLA